MEIVLTALVMGFVAAVGIKLGAFAVKLVIRLAKKH